MTRLELYELVWSSPMTAVAKHLGISDKAVASHCKRNDIPTPPRGHWTRVAASMPVERKPLGGEPQADLIVSHVAARRVRPEVGAGSAGDDEKATMESDAKKAPVPALSVSVDMTVVHALAADLHRHEAAQNLLQQVATQAAALPSHEANRALAWLSSAIAELEQSHPATRLAKLLQTAA